MSTKRTTHRLHQLRAPSRLPTPPVNGRAGRKAFQHTTLRGNQSSLRLPPQGTRIRDVAAARICLQSQFWLVSAVLAHLSRSPTRTGAQHPRHAALEVRCGSSGR